MSFDPTDYIPNSEQMKIHIRAQCFLHLNQSMNKPKPMGKLLPIVYYVLQLFKAAFLPSFQNLQWRRAQGKHGGPNKRVDTAWKHEAPKHFSHKHSLRFLSATLFALFCSSSGCLPKYSNESWLLINHKFWIATSHFQWHKKHLS